MTANVHFHRYDHQSTVDGFSYQSTTKAPDMEHDFQTVSMGKPGFNIHVQIQNYTSEPVYLGGSLRTTPTLIQSLQRDGYRPHDHHSNFVVVTIISSENIFHQDPKKRHTHHHKTEIRIPARMFNIGSVFIKELDSYIMTGAQLDATRELIARDVQHQGWEHITVPQDMVKTDPATLYNNYKQLSEYCILRQDKISLRIGIDLEYGKIPDIIKDMRVAILDSYFVPFQCYKLVYDPSLGPDDFVLENLHMASAQSFTSTWTELAARGTMYLNQDETQTLFGKFYGLVLFSGERALIQYVHARKSQERFDNETLYVSNRTGDPLLRERVVHLEAQATEQESIISDQTTALQSLRAENKRLDGELTQREKTITHLRTNHSAKQSTDMVMGEIANDRSRTQNERDRNYLDQRELDQRAQTFPLNQKAQIWKSWGEIIKSSWAIVAAIAGGLLSTFALLKKHNVKLSTA